MFDIMNETFKFNCFDSLEEFVRTWKKLCRGMVSNLCFMSVTVFADMEIIDRMQLWMAGNRHESVFLTYPELLLAYKRAFEYIYLSYALSSPYRDKANSYLEVISVIQQELERINNVK